MYLFVLIIIAIVSNDQWFEFSIIIIMMMMIIIWLSICLNKINNNNNNNLWPLFCNVDFFLLVCYKSSLKSLHQIGVQLSVLLNLIFVVVVFQLKSFKMNTPILSGLMLEKKITTTTMKRRDGACPFPLLLTLSLSSSLLKSKCLPIIIITSSSSFYDWCNASYNIQPSSLFWLFLNEMKQKKNTFHW